MNKGARLLSAWNRQNMIGEPLLGDQASVPTKSARLCTAAARGKVGVVVAKRAGFDGTRVTFTEVLQRDDTRVGAQWDDVTLDGVDTVVLCTGYQTDFSWLEAPGLDWNPRSWFKHCFPPGLGDKLMFLGWARPHQGGIPACAEILSRYIGMILAGTRTLPAAYAERAQREARDEDAYYLRARQSPNLVDYPAFMDSVARLVGCLPESPSLFRLQRLVQYWMYPNWPVWYRKDGPGAQPRLVGEVLDKFPLGTSYLPNPFILIALTFSFMQAPIGWLFPPRPGIEGRWAWKAKKHLLHGNG
jgi:dimethylaniline monooxygenase (N-oxide forming)